MESVPAVSQKTILEWNSLIYGRPIASEQTKRNYYEFLFSMYSRSPSDLKKSNILKSQKIRNSI